MGRDELCTSERLALSDCGVRERGFGTHTIL
jgi:hypothetical protein